MSTPKIRFISLLGFIILIIILLIISFNYIPFLRYNVIKYTGPTQAPELPDLKNFVWINSPPLDLQQLRKEKRVILIDFWTYTCINCVRATPYTEALWERYKEDGLVVIGVHTPEFEVEQMPENVKEAVTRAHISYPVVLDPEKKIWNAFHNRYWPAKYLINPEGEIIYFHFGEGGYEEEERMVYEALKDAGWNPTEYEKTPKFLEPINKRQTPELYGGLNFLRKNFGNREQPQLRKEVLFTLPKGIQPDYIYLEGKWIGFPDFVESATEGKVVLNYLANAVYCVLARGETPLLVQVLLDGKPVPEVFRGPDLISEEGRTYMKVDQPRLYAPIAATTAYGRYTLTLEVPEGLRLYSFTFGVYSED